MPFLNENIFVFGKNLKDEEDQHFYYAHMGRERGREEMGGNIYAHKLVSIYELFSEKLCGKFPVKIIGGKNLCTKNNFTHDKKLDYGTSGYRAYHSDILSVVPTVVHFSALYSILNMKLVEYGEKRRLIAPAVGLVITASHNKEEDNGIKFIRPDGRMLSEEYIQLLDNGLLGNKIPFPEEVPQPIILIFRDTRKSYDLIYAEIKNYAGDNFILIECGLTTTPLAHIVVAEFNNRLINCNFNSKNEFFLPSIENIRKNYFSMLFKFLPDKKCFFDCANGVGGILIDEFSQLYNLSQFEKLKLKNEDGILNGNRGAVAVKYSGIPDYANKLDKIAFAVDGDMDRLICMKDGKIFDGDDFICIMLHALLPFRKDESIGVILSDYSNIGLVNYLSRLEIENFYFERAETGIANFIRKTDQFDIAIYCEPNGHGGLVINRGEHVFLKELQNVFHGLIGDPFPLMLFLLKFEDSIKKYFQKQPTLMRSFARIEKMEEVEHMIAIMQKCKCLCSKCKGEDETYSRVFIRPSGTEPIVRVYCEGSCKTYLKMLMRKVEEYSKVD